MNELKNKNIKYINNKIEFKGNPIRSGKLSKKYLQYIKKNPVSARVPSRLLDKRSKLPKLKKVKI